MYNALGGTKAASKGQACLRPACWSRGFRRPPPSGFTKGMSVNFQGGGNFTCLPDPSSDEQLTPFTFLGGRELALAVLCFAIRSMACISLIRILTAFPRLTLQFRSLDTPRGRFASFPECFPSCLAVCSLTVIRPPWDPSLKPPLASIINLALMAEVMPLSPGSSGL